MRLVQKTRRGLIRFARIPNNPRTRYQDWIPRSRTCLSLSDPGVQQFHELVEPQIAGHKVTGMVHMRDELPKFQEHALQ
jgi:hypothetical protein